jgi:hypothetical protein
MLSVSAVAAFEPTGVNDDIEASDADEEPPSESSIIVSDIKSAFQDDYSLQTKDFSMYYKNGTRYEVTLSQKDVPLENASVTINICGIDYARTTDADGKASIAINLLPGSYSVFTTYDYGDSDSLVVDSDIEVFSTITGEDVVKTFKNDTQYYATFYDNYGNPLVDSDVSFNINGVFYNRKTNENGTARLNINLNSGEYTLTAIHQNGLMYSNRINVLPSISGSDITKFYKNGTQYCASFLNSAGNPLVKSEVSFNINGVFYNKTTDKKGMAKLNINLLPGSYILTAINPVNGEMFSNIVTVIPTMIASDVESENKSTCFDVILINDDGSLGTDRDVEITVDGISYHADTDDHGVACFDLNLSSGVHDVYSKDLKNGLTIHNIINITAEEEKQYYSIYGISPDNKTIMAIGRPSAPGELSKYGYKFYATELERICPYCKSTELYWSIFWAGDETTNMGIFPPTGNREGGSAEGHIFCAHCDADWSTFGNEHVYNNAHNLKVVSQSVLTTKDAAYMLKNGEMVYE